MFLSPFLSILQKNIGFSTGRIREKYRREKCPLKYPDKV
jgi:hypothetical protein